jgi:endothelin-converting enzyme
MDKESSEAAQAKARAIIPKIGYPLSPNTTDATSLKRYYSMLDIDKKDFFGNVRRATYVFPSLVFPANDPSVIDESRAWVCLRHLLRD